MATVHLPALARRRPLVRASRSRTIAPGQRVLVTGPSGSGKTHALSAPSAASRRSAGAPSASRRGPRSSCCRRSPISRSAPSAALSPIRPAAGRSHGATLERSCTRWGSTIWAIRWTSPPIGRRALRRASSNGISFARALLQKPDWLFLDEATSAVDEAGRRGQLYRCCATTYPMRQSCRSATGRASSCSMSASCRSSRTARAAIGSAQSLLTTALLPLTRWV